MKYWRGCLVSRVALIRVTIQLNIFSYTDLASAPVAYATYRGEGQMRRALGKDEFESSHSTMCGLSTIHSSSKDNPPAGHSAPW